MATAGSSAQSVDQKGKKPVIGQESHIAFPSKLCGRPRHYITRNTTRTKPASQRTNFHGASTTAGTSAWSILVDECIDSGVSDLDLEPTQNHPGSYCKKLTAKTEDGEVVLRVAGHMRLADGYKLVGQELGLLNPPGAVAGDFDARLREENKLLKEKVAQLVQEIGDMRRDNEALQGDFRKQKDESERLNTRKHEVTKQRDEAEKNSKELAHQVYELERTNWDLTEQHHQEVQELEELIDELQTAVNHGIGETERIRQEKTLLGVQVQQMQMDKTALESKCQQYEHDNTSLQNKVESLEEQIGLTQGVLNVILDQTSLDHDLRDEEIGSLRSDSDRWRAQIEELEEGNYVLHVAYAKSETELDQLRMLSERPQRSSLPMHRRNEVRRSQARPNWANLAVVRNERGEVGFMERREGRGGKDSEVKWLKRGNGCKNS